MPIPSKGLWIDPKGLAYPVEDTHQKDLQAYPRRFGLKADEVRNLSPVELFEINEQLIHQGWVRFRYMSGSYHFQVRDLEEKILVVEDVLIEFGVAPSERVHIAVLQVPEIHYHGNAADVFDRTLSTL